MDALVEEGFVFLGGPFGDGALVMLIVSTDSAAEVERRLADDPWIQMGILTIASVQPWQILLGTG
jgi:uncharacterized protein YciI